MMMHLSDAIKVESIGGKASRHKRAQASDIINKRLPSAVFCFYSYPLGLRVWKRQRSAHISSKPRSALKPSSRSAFAGEA
jgi:hypothetical protein